MGEMGQGSPHLEAAGRPAAVAADHHATHGKEHGHHKHAAHHKSKRKHKKHHRKHRKHHRRHLGTAGKALPTAPATPPPPSNAPVPAAPALLTQANANRLLWRAGFGPTPGRPRRSPGSRSKQVVQASRGPQGPPS